jgi:hypothetical protein
MDECPGCITSIAHADTVDIILLKSPRENCPYTSAFAKIDPRLVGVSSFAFVRWQSGDLVAETFACKQCVLGTMKQLTNWQGDRQYEIWLVYWRLCPDIAKNMARVIKKIIFPRPRGCIDYMRR